MAVLGFAAESAEFEFPFFGGGDGVCYGGAEEDATAGDLASGDVVEVGDCGHCGV